MEALLPARAKVLSAAVLALLLAATAAWLALTRPRPAPPARVEALVAADLGRMEAKLARLVRQRLSRSGRAAADRAAGRLDAGGLKPHEALVMEKDGVVADWLGEVFFFRPGLLNRDGWGLALRNETLYFQRALGGGAHFIAPFLDMGALREEARLPYPVFELKFFPRPPPGARDEFTHDQALGRFYCTRVFRATQGQLILNLAFSRQALERQALRRRRLAAAAAAVLLFLLLYSLPGGSGRRLWLRLAALAGMAAAAWLGLGWAAARDLYVPGRPQAVRSVFQLLALLLALACAGRLLLKRARPRGNFPALAAFNLLQAAAFAAVPVLLAAADFPFGDFRFHPAYLALLTLALGLLAAPLLAAARLAVPRPARRVLPLLALQALLSAAACFWLSPPPLAAAFLFLALAVLLLRPERTWLKAAACLLLTALTACQWLGKSSLAGKMEFVAAGLKPVFASQDDYAKLVAREIVYELNSRRIPFASLFEPGRGGELADCWENSLAPQENIASGIHVLGGDGKLLHSFSYLMPYIPLQRRDAFPFWHVENVDSWLFGRKVRLAVAAIDVFQRERFLGTVMVQVLNTADLVLRGGERQSVLSADRRLGDAGIQYARLDEAGRVLENPGNIDLPPLAPSEPGQDRWLRFSSLGIAHHGFAFRSGAGTTIVFFPRRTVFRSFSEYVKILGFLLLLAALLSLRRLRRAAPGTLLRSFSVKVFAILVLLSILTAGVFSLFSLNFNAQSQETRRSQAAHRRGRSALALANSLLADNAEITQSDLFLLQKVSETEISVYEQGSLLFASDQRRLIRAELPIYLDSGVRARLGADGQQFELRRGRLGLELYFRAEGGYVFRMEFPAESAEQQRARRYYVDFTVTIFFALLVIGLAAAFFFRNKIVAPIHRLNRGMADVRRGDLSPLGSIPAESELRELYEGFNSMLEGIQEQKRSASEIARMKTLVQLGRRVAHEVKNPLTPIRLSAEQIERSLGDDGPGAREVIASAVRYIVEETEHLRRVAFGFLNLSQLDELKPEPFLLNGLLEEALARLRPIYPQAGFTLAAAAPLPVVADRQKIRQALDNVLTNALEALEAGRGEVAVTLAQAGDEAVIRVRDSGAGMDPRQLERVAREEHSTKELGTGLGLVIARRFLELHHGALEIESRPGAGTTVTLRFAVHAQPA